MQKAKIYWDYHCDGYYNDDVCNGRAEVDVADIRKDKNGFLRQSKHFCKYCGISPFTNEACPHCMEMKKYFPKAAKRW